MDDRDEVVEVRHGKKQEFSIFYNVFIDTHARRLEYLEIAVYMVLCRFANSDSEAWPSYSKITEILGANRQSIMETLRRLEEKGLISIEKRERENGSKASNLYTILELEGGRDNLPGVVGTTYQGGRIDRGSRRRPIEEDQLKKTMSANGVADSLRPLSGFGIPGNTRETSGTGRIEKFVEKLYNALSEKRRITRRPSLIQWSASVKEFVMNSNVTMDELEKELEWYVKHIGEPYIPKAYSAQTFCDRFVDIQDARRRLDEDEESVETVPKPKVYVEASDEEIEELLRNA